LLYGCERRRGNLYIAMKKVEVSEVNGGWSIKTPARRYFVETLSSLYSTLLTLEFLDLISPNTAKYFIKRVFYFYELEKRQAS
jgi:hypothetical protein